MRLPVATLLFHTLLPLGISKSNDLAELHTKAAPYGSEYTSTAALCGSEVLKGILLWMRLLMLQKEDASVSCKTKDFQIQKIFRRHETSFFTLLYFT